MCDSILQHEGIMTAGKSIKLSPAKSVLKREFGDKIRLTEADFVSLSDAFFSEIARKYA